MIFIVLGARLGAALGGPMGALFGGGLGLIAGKALQASLFGNLRIAQSQLIDTTFAVMGALCKADGVVAADEIRTVEQIFRMLNLQGEQREQARAAFGRGKQSGFDLDGAVDEFALHSRRRAPLLQLFLQLQCMAVAADGRIDPAEHEMLVGIARRLGLHEADVSQLEALLRAATGGPSTAGAAPMREGGLSRCGRRSRTPPIKLSPSVPPRVAPRP